MDNDTAGEESNSGGDAWVWHPFIRALGWVMSWAMWALFVSIAITALVDAPDTIALGNVVARWLSVCALLPFGTVIVIVLDTWLRIVSHVERNYTRIGDIIAVTGVVCLTVAAAYSALVMWCFHRFAWPYLWAALGSRGELEAWRLPAWATLLLLAALIWFAAAILPSFPSRHLGVIRRLGGRRALRSYAIMVLLRARQQRRDFFQQVPVVREAIPIAVAAVLYRTIDVPLLAWLVPSLLIALSLAFAVNLLQPPLWVYLGRSDQASYLTFDRLRYQWAPAFGITLLNRAGREWFRHYSSWSQQHWATRTFAFNPGVPRVWSLRSRGDSWASSVQILMELAHVVIIDARSASYYVFDELLWTAELGLIDKCYILSEPDGSAPAIDAALGWAKKENVTLADGVRQHLQSRIVTEDQLHAARWTQSGLELARAASPDCTAIEHDLSKKSA